MLGQAISMVVPEVVGYKIMGHVGRFITSTDVVLTITKVCLFIPASEEEVVQCREGT